MMNGIQDTFFDTNPLMIDTGVDNNVSVIDIFVSGVPPKYLIDRGASGVLLPPPFHMNLI